VQRKRDRQDNTVKVIRKTRAIVIPRNFAQSSSMDSMNPTRNTILRFFVIAITVLLIAAPTQTRGIGDTLPDISTVSGFLDLCSSLDKQSGERSNRELYGTTYCTAWMDGLIHGIIVGEVWHDIPQKNFLVCLPEGNSYGQMIRILKKCIADHPEKEHELTEVLAVTALTAAFPCLK
jgi:hypothetical protein